MTEAKRQRWTDEGRGTGEGADYKPWLTYQDVASTGDKHRLHDGRFRRLCHLFSDVERRVFLYLDASRSVEAVYEQYPLDIDITREIARRLGIEHPRDRRSGVDITMTTDLVAKVRYQGGFRFVAFSCKLATDLGDFNNAEHAEIEHQYWLQKGVPWHFVHDGPACVPEHLFENLQTLYPRRFLHTTRTIGPLSFDERSEILVREIRRCSRPTSLHGLSLQLAADYGLQNEKWLHHAYHLIYRHKLTADLYQKDLSRHDVTSIARLTWGGLADDALEAA